MKQRILPFCFLFLFSLLVAGILLGTDRSEREGVPVAAVPAKTIQVILDAGHGGMDPGAVCDGCEEKILNLAVAKKLGAFLESAGVEVIYTRTEDEAVPYEGEGSRKTRDLLGRVEAAKKHPESLFVSLHMNTLPIEKYSGLQVFFADRNEDSHALAQEVQSTVKALLQPENTRLEKESHGKIFILDRIEQPAILVECGFLSNKEDDIAM